MALDMTNQFKNLAQAAVNGQLVFDPDTAKKCINICNSHVNDLQNFQLQTGNLVHVEAFGTLNSATALGKKFQDLAAGSPGSGSLQEAISKRIEVVQAMADMFKKAGDAYQHADAETQANIRAQMAKLDHP